MASHHGNDHSFHSFFQDWLARQQAFLDELIATSSNVNSTKDYKTHLIRQVLDHYKEYYVEKAKLIKEDVFGVISPSWFTSFERTLLWVGGFKPSLAFQIAETSVSDMVSEQVDQMNELKKETLEEEKGLMEVFGAMQDSVGFLPLKDKLISPVEGEVSEFDEAVHHLKDVMAALVFKADDLRESTAVELVHILNQDQVIQFLVAVGKCHARVRAWGRQMENLPNE